MTTKEIDVLCVGELVADIIATQEGKLEDVENFNVHLGGSPTNVASHLKRLGHRVELVATVGNDGLGNHLKRRLEEIHIDLKNLKTTNKRATSNIIIDRNQATPEFIPYRQADSYITNNQLPLSLLSKVNIFHTTCFALSKNPAQTTILSKAAQAFKAGCQLSIDLNYAEKIWHSQKQPLHVIEDFCQYNPLIKISEDDKNRLLGGITDREMFDYFHQLGVDKICYTKGKAGVIFSQKDKTLLELPAPHVKHIKDTTGAGDAFWSGFLSSHVRQLEIKHCLLNGLKYAAFKLQNGNNIPEKVEIDDI